MCLTNVGPKCGTCMLHYQVSTNLGLLQSNMTYMTGIKGLEYHWMIDILKLMGLPVLDGVEVLPKKLNTTRKNNLMQKQESSVQFGRIKHKCKYRVEEQHQRMEWGKIQHHYGVADEELDIPLTKMPKTPSRSSKGKLPKVLIKNTCKCGSTSHKRTSHHLYPLKGNRHCCPIIHNR